MKNVIYKIRNIVNDHYYIGSTVDSRKRFWAHRKDLRTGSHVCVHLQRAWNKYGEDCFKFEIIEQLDSKEALFPAEQKWLDEHFGQSYCYNVAAHADAPMRDASPELRAKLAERTKAWLERDGHPRQGAEWSVEQREQIRQSRVGKHAGGNHYRYGQLVSEEVRKKIGDAQRGVKKAPGRKVSEEGKAKIRVAAEAGHYSHWQGKQHTEESKAKMSKRILEITNNLEFPSLTAALKHFGMTMPTLNRALKSDKKISKGKFAGLWFRYRGIVVDKPNT